MPLRDILPKIKKEYTEPAGGGHPQSADGSYYASAGPSADARVMVGRDIEVFPSKPLDALANFETRAFEARDIKDDVPHLALLCGRSRGPRITAIGTYREIKTPHLLKLIDAGVVNWKPEGRQLFVFVFDMPPAKRLMMPGAQKPMRLSDDRIIPGIIQPILAALTELNAADMTHGAIIPENIYITGADGAEVAILGECLTSAPFFRTPAMYETIERAMAQPSGRGSGTIKNDLYALGICVAIALRGINPLAGKTAEQITREKIESGSYNCMIGGERIPAGLAEFLRGVLHDDENARWGMDETLRWLEERRYGTKQPHIMLKAARPFMFREKKYWDLRSLAAAFAQHPAEASITLEKDNFDLWVKRNFEDRDLESRLDAVRAKEDGALRERVVAGMCMALDPVAPVRYKNLSVFPGGYGTALADALARDEDIQSYADIIAMQLFNNWVQQRFEEIPDATSIITLFEKCRNFMAQKMPGYGIERILYLLNRETVCLSPLLREYYVLSPGHLLLALEALAARGQKPDYILDRHMISFISVRDPKMIDPYLGHIISHDRGYQMIGILRCLAAIQRRHQIAPVPALCNWMISMIAPAVDRFHDRDLRQEIMRRLGAQTNAGSLSMLLDLIDTPAVVVDDQQRFSFAQREFALLARERSGIDLQLSRRKTFGLASGRQVAMLVSAVLSALAMLTIILMHYL